MQFCQGFKNLSCHALVSVGWVGSLCLSWVAVNSAVRRDYISIYIYDNTSKIDVALSTVVLFISGLHMDLDGWMDLRVG